MAAFHQFARLAALTVTVGLAACQGSGTAFNQSPEGIPVALESLDGAPTQIRTALIGELNTAATDRKVELVGATAEARYRVRGYLSAEEVEGGTKVAYVWDVFDSENRRAKRLTGSSPVIVSYTSLSGLDRDTLARLANSSMDEIAQFLSTSKSQAPVQTASFAAEDESAESE